MSCTVLSESHPRARKRHMCDACGHAIEPGMRQYVQGQIYEGKPASWRVHEVCDTWMRRLHGEVFDDVEGVYHAGCLVEHDGYMGWLNLLALVTACAGEDAR